MTPRRLGVLVFAALCLLAGLVFGAVWIREEKALGVAEVLRSGWFASRTEAHLLRFLAVLERYAARGEPDRESFLERVDVLLLAVRRLVREPDGAGIMADPVAAALGFEVEGRLAELEPALAALQPGDDAAYGVLRSQLEAIERPLADLVAQSYEQFLAAAASTDDLARTLRRALLLSLGLAALGGGLLVWLLVGAIREARRAHGQADRAAYVAREAESSLRTLVDALPVAVTAVDEHGRLLLVNRHASELTGVVEAGALGRTASETDLPAALTQIEPADARGFRECTVEGPDGSRRHLIATARPVLRADGSLARTVHIALDVTDRRNAEERLRHLAEHDPLTGLANRSRFGTLLAAALARPGARVALHLLDLDGFKEVNDSLGHPVGDRLLLAVAGRLVRAAGPGAAIGRLGGDEFAVLQTDPDGPETARALADRLVASLSQPIVLPEGRLRVGASVGIALAPEHGRDVDELLRHADIALYRAKEQARGSIVFFSGELAAAQVFRHRLAGALELALQRGSLALRFQPILRLQDSRLVSREALLRWPDSQAPDPVSAAQLVSVAEETGLIVPLTEWVLRAACRQARSWLALGRPCPVAVNISMTPPVVERLEAMVAATLEDTGLPPHLLELEVTEGVLIRNFEQTTRVLERLRQLGVRTALDDFGTGYSALAYLQRFPLDKLKIDRQFTNELGSGPTALAIVDAIVRLGHALGLSIVAEGVERPDQLELLRRVGCDEAQGFLLGKPGDPEEVLRGTATTSAQVPPTAQPRPAAVLGVVSG